MVFSRVIGRLTAATCPKLRQRCSLSGQKSGPKVAVIGAAGGIGQPLGLLLKKNPLIDRLALYDIAPETLGVCADLSHIDTRACVSSHVGPDQLAAALEDADVVVVPAGVPRKPGMTRDDLFATNAGVVRDVAEMAAKKCPKAFLAIITNPVNSTVPIAAEVYKNNGVYDPKRIFGVTTLDVVRSQAFVAEMKQLDVATTVVNVVGGHSGVTIIPLLSKVRPAVKLSDAEIKQLTERVQDAGTEVVKAKAGKGSATLSMAVAGARFADALVRAIRGERSTHCSYVASSVANGLEYFASPVDLGPDGVEKIHGIDGLSAYEKALVDKAVPELKANIEKGIKFITG